MEEVGAWLRPKSQTVKSLVNNGNRLTSCVCRFVVQTRNTIEECAMTMIVGGCINSQSSSCDNEEARMTKSTEELNCEPGAMSIRNPVSCF